VKEGDRPIYYEFITTEGVWWWQETASKEHESKFKAPFNSSDQFNIFSNSCWHFMSRTCL